MDQNDYFSRARVGQENTNKILSDSAYLPTITSMTTTSTSEEAGQDRLRRSRHGSRELCSVPAPRCETTFIPSPGSHAWDREVDRAQQRWSVWTATSTLHSEGDDHHSFNVLPQDGKEAEILQIPQGAYDLSSPGSIASSSLPLTSDGDRQPPSVKTMLTSDDDDDDDDDEARALQACFAPLESYSKETADDSVLDSILASSSQALLSAQEALKSTVSERVQLKRWKASEAAMERLLDKREIELLSQLDANRRMEEHIEKVTSDLGKLLRCPVVSLGDTKRFPSYASSRGGWNLAASESVTGTGSVGVGASTNRATTATDVMMGLERDVTGIVEAPQDAGVTMGKCAARRLERMLGRQGSTMDRHSASTSGSGLRVVRVEKKDAHSMLASLAAASNATSPTTGSASSLRHSWLDHSQDSRTSLPPPSSPFSKPKSSPSSVKSSSISVSDDSFSATIAQSMNATTRSTSISSWRQRPIAAAGPSSSRAVSFAETEATSPPPDSASFPASLHVSPSPSTLTTSPIRPSALLGRKRPLHRSTPSAPAVVASSSFSSQRDMSSSTEAVEISSLTSSSSASFAHSDDLNKSEMRSDADAEPDCTAASSAPLPVPASSAMTAVLGGSGWAGGLGSWIKFNSSLNRSGTGNGGDGS